MKLGEHPTVKRIRSRQSQGVVENQEPLDADWLRHLVLEAGADDVGFVEIDRPELADQREDIRRFFPPTKSLISFVCRMNREPIRSPARSVANLEFHHTGHHVDDVAHRVVAALERKGIRAVNPAMGFPMEMIAEHRDGYPHRLRAVGHLHEAEDESQAWPGLHDAIRAERKAYQQLGTMPDFAAIIQQIAPLRPPAAPAQPEADAVTAGESVKEA